MPDIGTVGLLILIANGFVSYQGFENWEFLNTYKFQVDKILINKDYKRLISSGFLHVNWTHLIFNMFSLYSFGASLELRLGSIYFALIYFTSLLAGNLFALLIHKNHGKYSAVGASGAVCGVIFASIALIPNIGVDILFLPVSIPGWLFGLLYISYTIYGIKSNNDNIGHEAHLGGAVIGMITAIIISPSSLTQNYIPILLSLVPTLIFIFFILVKPHLLLVDNPFKTQKKPQTIDEKYNEERALNKKEFNLLLEKIHKKGIDKLTAKEKEKLDEYSKANRK
ncbi:rhomboid family intramembrane serine protease [uncultured Tenacibaculum sp.]|uniref:rhomboid family intramembrane serine protease n=1 Tax=uncultured Tenacibaculum sp. TaxID=174713 RepID=UPI00263093EA|nr:rhomboid family intramembrane serine protease [uncultured Tenacibaculum sp.]